jgi:polyphosphate glucokinase
MSKQQAVLGIDIGGTGIKGAIVDVASGKILSERLRVETPSPATPEAIAKSVKNLIDQFDWHGLVGAGFPAIVKNGVAYSASNIHEKWLGTNVEKVLRDATGLEVYVANDADVAGLGAVKFGAAKGKKGVVLFLTIGTGIGSALFIDGRLVPDTEFGHLYLGGKLVERQMSNSVRKRDNLSIEEWGKRLNKFLLHLERILSPDLIIIGGGTSKRFDELAPFFKLKTPVIPALLLNNAGIIGAALWAAGRKKSAAKSSK